MSGDGSQEPLESQFPETKEAVEKKVFSEFLEAARRNNQLPFEVESWELNETDHFDVTMQTSLGPRYVELMEYAPLEGIKGGHEGAPNTFIVGDRVWPVFKSVRRKSRKYGERQRDHLLLMIYSTDWKFNPFGPERSLLAYLLHGSNLNFSHVFVSCSVGGGAITFPIFPTPAEQWQSFDAERAAGSRARILDPQSWKSAGDGGFFQDI